MPDITEQIRDATERVLWLLLGVLIAALLVNLLNQDIGRNSINPLVPDPKPKILQPRQI